MNSLDERPSADVPLIPLTAKVTPSLTKQLETLGGDQQTNNNSNEEVLKEGTLCKNAGCQVPYKSEESNYEMCQHHPGVPIFHEGMKFWTCCQKKTSDFSTFLAQSGCTSGKHLWIKNKDEESEKPENSCRFDWFQFGNNVVVTVYSKNPIPTCCSVQANQVHLKVTITFGLDRKRFEKSFNLFGVVDLSKSSVVYSPNKTEITLRKVDFIQWPTLESND